MQRLGDIQAGEDCLEVSGHISSYDPEGWKVTLWADGYDETGAKVAYTQESALIPGQLGLRVAYGETVEFVMHLNAPEEIDTIQLYAQSFSHADFQPGPPSTPLPQSEMIRITFSKEWLLENDVEPDEDLVTITFLESWLRHTPDIPEREETVEFAVPRRLLMDHNTSEHPAMITVTFPRYYFDGL
jgi:hypothetical protein